MNLIHGIKLYQIQDRRFI